MPCVTIYDRLTNKNKRITYLVTATSEFTIKISDTFWRVGEGGPKLDSPGIFYVSLYVIGLQYFKPIQSIRLPFLYQQ